MNKKIFEISWLILFVGLLAIVILGPFIINDVPFVLGWDYRTQYSLFFEQFKNVILGCLQTKSLPFYSWTDFLGSNFYCGKLFYYLNIYDWLFVLSQQRFEVIQMYLLVIKMIVSGISFYLYADHFKYKSTTKWIGAVCYAFSSFAIDATKDPFFLSFYTFVPLYFLCIEYYFEKSRKCLFYVPIVTLLLITNYYQFYTLSIITVLYFLYRYYCIHSNFQGVVFSAIKLIGLYCIGVFISCFATLPNFYHILSNSRLFAQSSLIHFESIQPYFYSLIGMFFPTSIICNRSLDFTSIFTFVSANQTDLYITVFSSMVITILLPQAIKKNKPLCITYFIFLLILIFPIGNSMMHGFSEPSFRWLQFVVFFNIISVLDILDDESQIDIVLLRKTIVVGLIILLSTIPLMTKILNYDFPVQEYMFFIGAGFILVLYYVIFELRIFKAKLILVLFELSLICYFSYYDNPFFKQYSHDTLDNVYSVLGEKDEFNNYLLNLSESNNYEFYRVYVDKDTLYWGHSPNMQLHYNIPGVLTYNSMIDGYANDLNRVADSTAAFDWYMDIKNPSLLTLVNVKYAIVTSEDAVPFSKYSKVAEFYELPIYQNEDYINLGKSYDNVILYEALQSEEDVLTSVVCDVEDLLEISDLINQNTNAQVISTEKGTNSLYSIISAENSGFFVAGVGYDKGWKVVVNGKETKTYSVNGGMIGFEIDAGINEVEMHFIPEGFKFGVMISALGCLLFGFGLVFAFKRNKSKQ